MKIYHCSSWFPLDWRTYLQHQRKGVSKSLEWFLDRFTPQLDRA
jgi:hypothetical protein